MNVMEPNHVWVLGDLDPSAPRVLNVSERQSPFLERLKDADPCGLQLNHFGGQVPN